MRQPIPGVAWTVQAPKQGESMMIGVMATLVLAHRSDTDEWAISAYESERLADQQAKKAITLFERKFGTSFVIAGPVKFTVPQERYMDSIFIADTIVDALEHEGPTECDGML